MTLTTPTKGNKVSVPILYVGEEAPNSRYLSETQKQQRQEINATHKPKPKAQENRKQLTWRKIERTTTPMIEEPNGWESVGMKWRHQEHDEDDTTEINGAYKRQKPLEDSTDIPSTMVAINQPCRA